MGKISRVTAGSICIVLSFALIGLANQKGTTVNLNSDSEVEQSEVVSQEKLVVGINANKLLAACLADYGFSLVRLDLPTGETRSQKLDEIYTTVKAEDPVIEHISIKLEDRMGGILPRGLRFKPIKDGAIKGSVSIGVFSSPEEASNIYEYKRHWCSMLPLEKRISAVGNRCTDFGSYDRVFFTRDNVVVDISLANAMEIAKAIDTALVKGTLGVRRGATVRMPTISSVEIPKEIFARTKIEATLHISFPSDSSDPKNAYADIIRKIPIYVQSIKAGTGSQNFNYKITYITPDCIVSMRDLTITAKPPAPK